MEKPLESEMNVAQRCLYQARLFFVALQFFTRLPVPRWTGFSEVWLKEAIRYFPAVGIIVGMITAGSYALFAFIWNPMLAALLSISLGIFLTGALHEDGFADVCDGFGGGYSQEHILEIMKDSRIGAYGAIGVGMLLAVKCISLASLPPAVAAIALLCAHPLSRLASLLLVWRMDYARTEGRAKSMAGKISTADFVFGLAIAIVPMIAAGLVSDLPWQMLAAGTAAMFAAAIWLAFVFLRRIGGYTGDCLGAVQQLSETVFYLGLVAALNAWAGR